MKNDPVKLSDSDVLILGLAFTSRTETLEAYVRDKAKSLTVMAISSCFLKENLSSCRVYAGGVLKKEFPLFNLRLKDYRWYRQPGIILFFIINWLSIGYGIMRLGKKFDLCIGISHSFALAGAALKKTGLVKRLIYYCIDYYIPERKINFNTLFVRLINIIEKYIVRAADIVWDISAAIKEYRQKLGGIAASSYISKLVPLSYSNHLRSTYTINEINRWDIGFVGSVTENQGLQLLIEVLPSVLKKLPQLQVKIIGQGPYLGELERLVTAKNLEGHVTFLGFIRQEQIMLEILTRCAIVLSIYSEEGNSNIICADSGKPKLYALRGLPMIVTDCCLLSSQVRESGSGMVIGYNARELSDALSFMLVDTERLKAYRENSYRLGEMFLSDTVMKEVLQ